MHMQAYTRTLSVQYDNLRSATQWNLNGNSLGFCKRHSYPVLLSNSSESPFQVEEGPRIEMAVVVIVCVCVCLI